jgi:iron complex outermembrane receptor protein
MEIKAPDILLVASFALPLAAAAQDQPPSDEIEELIVSAACTEQSALAIAGTVSIIDRETIRKTTAISDDLASVLSRTIPGFAPSSQKLAGRGETLRGRNPLYLIDGVPQHNALRANWSSERVAAPLDLVPLLPSGKSEAKTARTRIPGDSGAIREVIV